MHLKQIELKDIGQYKGHLLVVHWATDSIMPFEYDEFDNEKTWGYTDCCGEIYTLNESEEPELITSIHVVCPCDETEQ